MGNKDTAKVDLKKDPLICDCGSRNFIIDVRARFTYWPITETKETPEGGFSMTYNCVQDIYPADPCQCATCTKKGMVIDFLSSRKWKIYVVPVTVRVFKEGTIGVRVKAPNKHHAEALVESLNRHRSICPTDDMIKDIAEAFGYDFESEIESVDPAELVDDCGIGCRMMLNMTETRLEENK